MEESGARDGYGEVEDDDGCESELNDGLHSDEEDDGGGEEDDDEVKSDQEGDDDEELEREWAAMEIQHAWRAQYHRHDHNYQQQQQQQYVDLLVPPVDSKKKKSESVCCSCFGLIDESETSAFNDLGQDSDDQVFCIACLYIMARTVGGSATPSSIASPLPKLSMLVQAEAKYNDQLQLLRAKQELLRQQQQEMQNRKSAEAKQLVAERALARERRRLFRLTMERKKRDEELKYHHQQLSSSSHEQEDGDGSAMTPQPATDSSTRRKKMKEMIPIPLRRTLQMTAAGSETSSPLTLLPGMDKKNQQQQRKTHFLKKMVGCYAQDLTPLVNGHKPRLLPVPSPVVSTAKKYHQQSPSLSRASPHTKTKGPVNNNKLHLKSKKPPVKLHPIEARATRKPNNYNNNQHDEDVSSPSSFSSYSHLSSSSTQPLTAEIKPVSWIYELGKGVLDEELPTAMTGSYHHALQQDAPQALARFAQLDSVQEESEPLDHLSFDLRLQHKLPAKTILAPSSLALPSAPASTTIAQQQQQPQWEYSTDRLANLLEKYNVSVTSTTK